MPGRLGSGIDTERSASAPASPYPLPRRAAPDDDSTASGFLRAVPMFAGLSEPLRRQIAAQAEWVHVEAGQWLFRTGDGGDSLYVVRSGRLEVLAEQPEPVLVRTLSRGAVVGELALLTREPRSASVRARRDSELLRVSSTDFAELLSHERRFSIALLRELGRQLRVSRGLEPPDDPMPATIAIVPAAGEPVAAPAERLRSALTAHGSVALLDDTAIADEAAYGAGLDRAERAHDRVLLSGCEGRWGSFCLRQADRVLLIAGDRPPPGQAPWPPGCDVVLNGPVDAGLAAQWERAVDPRAVHWLDWGAGTDEGFARLARRLAGRSLGVVLSSGGARGLSHIGVLQELLDAGLTIDRVAGSSMGAFVGAMFAMGMSPGEIHERCREEFVRRRPLSDYAVPTTSLLRGGRARAMLVRTFGESTTFAELQRDFFCVSCDLVSGRPVTHRRGSLYEAVGASMCLPGVFAPIPRDGRLLVDGGVLDSLPVEAMAATGEGPILAVDVGRRFERAPVRRFRRSRAGVPVLKETLARSIVLGSLDAAQSARMRADVLIEPDTGACGMLEFTQLDAMVAAGRRAARGNSAYAMLRQDGAPPLH